MKFEVIRRAFSVLVFSAVTAFSCNSMAIGYSAVGGKILDPSGNEIHLRGVSHYGFNTPILQPQYLVLSGKLAFYERRRSHNGQGT